MPSLPTSLILLGLVAAWIWVLVPMFARSREAVPETDDGTAGFRVLRRVTRRPLRRRTESAADDVGGGGHDVMVLDAEEDAGSALVDELVDDDSDDALLEAASDGDREALARLNSLTDDQFARGDSIGADSAGADSHYVDAADEWEHEHTAAGPIPPQRRPADRATVRPAVDRPRPRRTGRGGFDPEHAAATARYRFRRRRLMTLLLLLLAVGCGVGSSMVDQRLWLGSLAFGLMLVGYLAYLSRQVKIERAINERRMARVRRARNPGGATHFADHDARRPVPAGARPGGRLVGGPADTRRRMMPPAARQAPTAGPPAPRYSSHLPPSRRQGYTVLDVDDNDPAFDELDHYEPVVYRRAAGQ